MRRVVGHSLLGLSLATLALAPPAFAWNVGCENDQGVKCPDPFAIAQTFWGPLDRAEHRALLDKTLEISGLPQVLRNEFTLDVFALDKTLEGGDGATYPSVRPVVIDAERRRSRRMSIPGMANLPDFAYTLWDLASGNELCPPDPSVGADALDCHNYETHIGWLNSNHMLPQSRKWYEHLHALALAQAADCKRQTDAVPLALRDRYLPYLLACEKQALMLEGVGQHYLEDSWSSGHLWERWGGTEEADFDDDRALGFAVGAFTGLIHGGKEVFDNTPGFKELAPWDDPMCAPHENVTYVDQGVTPVEQHPGTGDIFLPALRGEGEVAAGDRFGPQRRALLGCAVDGVRAVYAATGRVHGALADPQFDQFDLSRSVGDDSCWAQRATNRALAEGCGIHRGAVPDAERFLPDQDAVGIGPSYFGNALQPLIMAQLTVAPLVAGAPIIFNPITSVRFAADASYTCATALAHAIDPQFADATNLASGGLPSLAGIEPNHVYARGNPAAKVPPAFWADPFPPWSLNDSESDEAPRKEVLNLLFADANAAQRCRDFSPTDLEDYVTAVEQAVDGGELEETIDARCGQCEQLIAPHLRHGKNGDHDTRREAFCALVAPDDAAFIYTDENPAKFKGTEPVTFAALQKAAGVRCGCETTTTTTTTTTTLGEEPAVVFVCNSVFNNTFGQAQVPPDEEHRCADQLLPDPNASSAGDSRQCEAQSSFGDNSASASATSNLDFSLTGAVPLGFRQFGASGASVTASNTAMVDRSSPDAGAFELAGAGAGVTCKMTVNRPVTFSATAGGSATGTRGRVEVALRQGQIGALLAGLEVVGGVTDSTFPFNAPVGPGLYEFSVGATESADFSDGASASASATFSLSIEEQP